MKPKYLVGILVGLLLVYVALFGLTVPNLAALTTARENYNSYTKVDDSQSLMSVTANQITVAISGSEDAYVYKDEGAGFFTNFVHQVDFRVTSITPGPAGFAQGWIWTLTNTPNSFITSPGGNDLQLVWSQNPDFGLSAVKLLLRTWQTPQSSVGSWSTQTYNLNTWYYCTITKNGQTVACSIYSDSARTALFETVTLAMPQAVPLEYVIACAESIPTGGQYTGGFQVANLNLGTGSSVSYSQVTITYQGSGSTNPAAGSYPATYTVGGQITVTATSGTIDHLTASTGTVSGTTVTNLGSSCDIVVYFAGSGTQYSDVTITISGSGSTSPTAGSHPNTYAVGSNIVITATSGTITSITASTGTVYGSVVQNIGTSCSITVYMTGGSSVGGGWPDLNSYLTPAVRALFMLAGIAIAGICLIMTFAGPGTVTIMTKPFGT